MGKSGVKQSRMDARYFREKVIAASEGKCQICDLYCPFTMEVHHIVPVSEKGHGFPSNLLGLCPNCHAVIEKAKTGLCENPKFDNWILSAYGGATYDKLMQVIHRVWGNQAWQ